MSCVFCHKDEGHVCSNCVQKLLAMPDEETEEAFTLAMEKGFLQKAEAIGQLIDKEISEYERERIQEAGTMGRDNNRARAFRIPRAKKGKPRPSKVPQKIPIRQRHPIQPSVSVA